MEQITENTSNLIKTLKVALLVRRDTQVKMDSLKDHIANHKNSMIESDVK